jgi:hypothetical protein
VLQSIVDHDAGTALDALNPFIDRSGVPAQFKCDALGLRAELRFDAGDYSGARADLLLAHSLASPSYLKYVHELSLASVYRAERNPSEALKWYRSALRTCVDATGVSGGTALKNFVTLVGAHISADDMVLCRAAIARSCVVLGLPGEAATRDLAAAIARIKEAETRPRS